MYIKAKVISDKSCQMKINLKIIYVIYNNSVDGFSQRSCFIPMLYSSDVYVAYLFPDLDQSCRPCVCFSARVFVLM